MSEIAVRLSRATMGIAVAVLALMSVAPQPAYAQAPLGTVTPPAPTGERLQQAWARQQRVYARLGNFLDKADQRIARAQQLIDRARANGKDVSALQAALDGFSDAVKAAHPVYQGGQGLVASHQGFDDNGNVTDFVKAVETVQEMRAKLVEIRQIVRPAVVALRQAVRTFRQANRPTPIATPGA